MVMTSVKAPTEVLAPNPAFKEATVVLPAYSSAEVQSTGWALSRRTDITAGQVFTRATIYNGVLSSPESKGYRIPGELHKLLIDLGYDEPSVEGRFGQLPGRPGTAVVGLRLRGERPDYETMLYLQAKQMPGYGGNCIIGQDFLSVAYDLSSGHRLPVPESCMALSFVRKQ